MKTRITELFGIQYPIILSGMSWISTQKLVAAVSNAGGLGILAAGVMTADETRQAIRETRELTDKPFGVNIPLYCPGAERNAMIAIEEKVPILNYALGKGDKLTKAVHEYGGKVVATVTTLKHAQSAQKDGADAVIVTGHEAAGHGGDVTSLVLVPTLADGVDIPVIAAGGFADGRGLATAFLLGAEGIAMGTRFMNSVESPVHETQKKLSTERGAFDTIYTPKVDGMPARFLKTEGAVKMDRKALNPFMALYNSRRIAKMLGFPWIKLAIGILFMGFKRSMQMMRMAVGFKAFEVGTMDGDNVKGVLPIGQVTELVHDTPTVETIITRIVKEAEEARKQLNEKL